MTVITLFLALQAGTIVGIRTPVGHVIQAVYADGFHPGVVTASEFPSRTPLPGITTDGRRVTVTVDSLVLEEQWMDGHFYSSVDGDLPEVPGRAVFDTMGVLQDSMNASFQTGVMPDSAFMARYSEVSRRAIQVFTRFGDVGAVVFWSGDETLSSVAVGAGSLTPSERDVVQREQERLWAAALLDLPEGERPAGYSLDRSEVTRIPGTNVVWVWNNTVTPRGDARGSFCIAMSGGSDVLYSTFGHPEWDPRSSVVETRPYFLFRINGDPRLYILAHQAEAWEDYIGAWTLFDASSGEVVASSR